MHRGNEKNCRGITNSVQSIRSKNGGLKVTERAILLHHSMARANLNKSVWLVTNTTTASKYIPRRTRISIN